MTASREGERRGKTRQPSPDHHNITPAPGHMPDHPRISQKRQASSQYLPVTRSLLAYVSREGFRPPGLLLRLNTTLTIAAGRRGG
jgi:hypothetical protein